MSFNAIGRDADQQRAVQADAQTWNVYNAKGDAFWKANRISESKKEKLKNARPQRKTTSVIIPCYYRHARHLYSLLRMYEDQTRLPDEVVISLSEVQRVDPKLLEQLQNEQWAFPITLVVSEHKRYAGENRNSACKYARGDILLCQDADDIPHPQRVEIIHYFFSTYALDHLMYEYRLIQPKENNVPFQFFEDISQVQFGCMKDFEKVWHAARFTNGNVAIARHVLEKIPWSNKRKGEDTTFNREAYRTFKHCIIIRAILHGYRAFLSSSVKVDVKNEEIFVAPAHNEVREKRHSLKEVKARKGDERGL